MSDERRETLRADTPGVHDITIVTISGYRDPVINGRLAPLLEFEEFPDHVLWLNRSGMAHIAWVLGEDTEKWIGKKIPLVKVKTRNPQTNTVGVRVHVANGPSWRSRFNAAGMKDSDFENDDDMPF